MSEDQLFNEFDYGRWIRVEEAAPPVRAQVLMQNADDSICVGMRINASDNWNFRSEPENRVVAWMPLPAPLK